MCRLPHRRGAVEPLNLDYESLSGVDRAGLEPAWYLLNIILKSKDASSNSATCPCVADASATLIKSTYEILPSRANIFLLSIYTP